MLEAVDAAGPKMDQSETVTFFNDMCVLAPATLIDRSIHWQTVDEHSVDATFTHVTLVPSTFAAWSCPDERSP